jgi:cytidylate kinase
LRKINIAIDGFSSCGKSTLAKALARELHYNYVDTGAMYRALALYALRNGYVDEEKNIRIAELEKVLPDIHVEFHVNPENRRSEVYLEEEAVEPFIRTIEVAEMASRISKHRAVRNKLQAIQRYMALRKGVVMDGRDVGTVVMPEAELKIFMTADPEIRAVRRFKEMQAQGKTTTLDEVRKNQAERDYEDMNRKEDPLRQADDAIVLDNSHLNEEEQLQFVLHYVRSLADMVE